MVDGVPGKPGTEDVKSLILQAKGGDESAFEQLYRLYYTPVFRYLYLRTKKRHEAEDLAQVVFLKVYNSLQRFEVTDAHPLSYFFTIARTSLIDHFRKEKNAPIFDDEMLQTHGNNEADPHDYAEAQEHKDLVRQALDELTDDQKEIITLKFLDELSNKEIAEITGKKEEAIRQLQLRALRKLKEHFKKEDII